MDLYLGFVLLDVLARGELVTAEKRQRLARAKKITLMLLALTLVWILLKLIATKGVKTFS